MRKKAMALLLTLALCVGLLPSVALADGLADEGSIAVATQEDAGTLTTFSEDETEEHGGIATYADPITVTVPNKTLTLEYGDGGSISVTVVGAGAPTYQWYQCDDVGKNNATSVGTNSNTCDIEATLDAGTYYYYCTVTPDVGAPVDSEVITVTIIQATENESDMCGILNCEERRYTYDFADYLTRNYPSETFTYELVNVSFVDGWLRDGTLSFDEASGELAMQIKANYETYGYIAGTVVLRAESQNYSVTLTLTIQVQAKDDDLYVTMGDWIYGDAPSEPVVHNPNDDQHKSWVLTCKYAADGTTLDEFNGTFGIDVKNLPDSAPTSKADRIPAGTYALKATYTPYPVDDSKMPLNGMTYFNVKPRSVTI